MPCSAAAASKSSACRSAVTMAVVSIDSRTPWSRAAWAAAGSSCGASSGAMWPPGRTVRSSPSSPMALNFSQTLGMGQDWKLSVKAANVGYVPVAARAGDVGQALDADSARAAWEERVRNWRRSNGMGLPNVSRSWEVRLLLLRNPDNELSGPPGGLGSTRQELAAVERHGATKCLALVGGSPLVASQPRQRVVWATRPSAVRNWRRSNGMGLPNVSRSWEVRLLLLRNPDNELGHPCVVTSLRHCCRCNTSACSSG